MHVYIYIYRERESARYLFHVRDQRIENEMGWLRLVGTLKLQVSFAKEPYKRDYILQKKLIIVRSLPIVATP